MWMARIDRPKRPFVLPRADIVAVFLEASTIIRDPLGTTTGEPRFALTQVVEGFGAKDLWD